MAKSDTQRQKSRDDRHRAAGLVQRRRWAHPDDWAAIDAEIDRLCKNRDIDLKNLTNKP